MRESFELRVAFNVKPSVIYEAWLNSEEHSKMTGGEANCSHQIGGTFFAWDHYISGTNKSLKINEEIIQSWRTEEFKETDEDSNQINHIFCNHCDYHFYFRNCVGTLRRGENRGIARRD